MGFGKIREADFDSVARFALFSSATEGLIVILFYFINEDKDGVPEVQR